MTPMMKNDEWESWLMDPQFDMRLVVFRVVEGNLELSLACSHQVDLNARCEQCKSEWEKKRYD